ncbi:Uncharacterised protein [Mycobacteroides abscessus subsp. bolletii]|uniref:hypothetical protein n=1 Tax=Mycobacteroides abscessus TaxID=36809 RepID=UPI0009264C28|nr:hypothetical protein [Mycobacteroides abscessus]SIJ61876.1 Uncharacterised protein [Mycobacteroides abscessus subsp. bolletii]
MTTTFARPRRTTDPTVWMSDFCPMCCPDGHYADSCVRLATLTEPDAITWYGGTRLVLEYVCDGCGHCWRRADLWTAREAGFDPKHRRAAA